MTQSANEPIALLRALANRWALRARDHARDSKANDSTDAAKAAYQRGLAEGFYKAATELAETMKTLPAIGTTAPIAAPSTNPVTSSTDEAVSAEPAKPAYLKVSLNEALDILTFAGLTPRDITPNKDNTFTAVFSRWENMQPHERLDRLKRVDHRLVVLKSGMVKDAFDPFIEFAWRGE